MSGSLVIFDCDGVLIDSEVISAAVLIELAAEAGVAIDAPYVREHFLGRSFPTVAKTIRERFRVELAAGFEAAYRARLLRRFETELTVTAGLWEALGRLRAPACVATSSSPERAARSLAITGLDRVFPHVFTASQVARGKPAPDLFLHAAARMEAAPASCLVIEDSRPGLLAARAAGMAAALFTGASHMAGLDVTDLDKGGLDADGLGTDGLDAGGFDTDPPLRAFETWASLADGHPALFGPSPPRALPRPPSPPGPRA